MQMILSGILTVLLCVALVVFIGMQVTKMFWAWKSKGESLKPRGVDDKTEEGGEEK